VGNNGGRFPLAPLTSVPAARVQHQLVQTGLWHWGLPVGAGDGGSERLSPAPALGAVRSAAAQCKSSIPGSIEALGKASLTYIKDGGPSTRLGRGSEITAVRSKGIKHQDVQYFFASQRDS